MDATDRRTRASSDGCSSAPSSSRFPGSCSTARSSTTRATSSAPATTPGSRSGRLTAIGNIGTAVALYPLARRSRPGGALGYVAVRILESTIIVAGIVSVLGVLTLRQQFAGTDADPETLTIAGQTLVAFRRLAAFGIVAGAPAAVG